MIKKILLLLVLLAAVGTTQAQTRYFTVKSAISYKNKVMSNKLIVDTGTDPQHPLYHKMVQIDNGGIRYTKGENDIMVFNNEVDLITYFENNGWDLVSVNEVMIIESKYLQYLFKSE